MKAKMLDYFKQGGVFLFDENDGASEAAYYMVEDLMGQEEGADITETYTEDESLCLIYDCGILSEEEAIDKYNNGLYRRDWR